MCPGALFGGYCFASFTFSADSGGAGGSDGPACGAGGGIPCNEFGEDLVEAINRATKEAAKVEPSFPNSTGPDSSGDGSSGDGAASGPSPTGETGISSLAGFLSFAGGGSQSGPCPSCHLGNPYADPNRPTDPAVMAVADAISPVLPGLPAIKALTNADKAVDLYRFMSRAELDDILRGGKLRLGPGAMEVKQFGLEPVQKPFDVIQGRHRTPWTFPPLGGSPCLSARSRRRSGAFRTSCGTASSRSCRGIAGASREGDRASICGGCWTEFSTSCGPAANGRRLRRNSGVPVRCITTSRNGRRRECSSGSGRRRSTRTTLWKGSTGAGRAWMER